MPSTATHRERGDFDVYRHRREVGPLAARGKPLSRVACDWRAAGGGRAGRTAGRRDPARQGPGTGGRSPGNGGLFAYPPARKDFGRGHQIRARTRGNTRSGVSLRRSALNRLTPKIVDIDPLHGGKSARNGLRIAGSCGSPLPGSRPFTLMVWTPPVTASSAPEWSLVLNARQRERPRWILRPSGLLRQRRCSRFTGSEGEGRPVRRRKLRRGKVLALAMRPG